MDDVENNITFITFLNAMTWAENAEAEKKVRGITILIFAISVYSLYFYMVIKYFFHISFKVHYCKMSNGCKGFNWQIN